MSICLNVSLRVLAKAHRAARVKAAMQLHYAEKDDYVNKGREPWVAALKKAGVKVEANL